MKTLAERLKLMRNGSSQKEFSAKLGVSQSSYCLYEKGERVPDIELANRICNLTNATPEWFMMGTGPMFKDECPTRRRFSDEQVAQPTENIERQTSKSVAMSDTSAIQTSLIESYKATAALQRELTDSIRENADLRVELERQKAQVRDLEREKAALAQKIQEIQQTATEITDMSVVRLAHENEELKSQLARLNRLGIFDEPDTRMPQAGVQDRK